MKKIGDKICKNRVKILILTLVLMIPTLIGYFTTKVNYDILVYLPEDIETIKGQNILTDEFNMGAFSVSIIENMSSKDILDLENNIRKLDGVSKVVTSYDLIGTTIPIEILPTDIKTKLKKDNFDLMLITFETGTSNETTLNAVEKIKELTNDKTKIGGMSAMVLDTMDLSETEIIIYIIIAVILCIVVLEISLDSYIVPFLLLINIGISILFNLGTNIIFGEISYITKALVAVLQLGVTTDFSIFLYHAYEKAKKEKNDNIKAMSKAIHQTFTSVIGSSLTTIAGFLVLCTMKLTLGTDLGLVMAKGVLLGVICVLTIFPSLLLVCDKLIEKTKHAKVLPSFTKINNFIIKHNKTIFTIFIILIIPAYLANSKVDVYYKLDESLPNNLDSIIANDELKENFNIVSPEIILIDKSTSNKNINDMINELENLEGIDFVLSYNKLSNLGISKELLSEETISIFESNNYELILINSLYEIASDELNEQVDVINTIIHKYDEHAILAGEGPLMKDLVTITDTDFKNVNYSSIICILIIMLFVLKSFSLPILLICTIEFAIFINMSIPYFTGLELPFVAPIVLGTIQLGATIDYAILMTTTYLTHRKNNAPKEKAIKETLNTCVNSILVSGLCFFAATFGVGIYSKLEMISSLCTLISRGAIISMIVVIFVLPSILLIFDKLIIKTTIGFKKKGNDKMKNKTQKLGCLLLITSLCLYSFPIYALTKEETIYANLKNDGTIKKVTVNNHLINDKNDDIINDMTDLTNIININGNEKFTQENNTIKWEYNGSDIYYKGETKKELPINMTIKYYQNNEEKELSSILGQSGNFKIQILYKNKDIHNVNGETLYTPFLVTTGLLIKGENNKNIIVNNGKVINNGINNIVIGLSSPGLYESLGIEELKNMNEITIEFESTNFELPNIYGLVTPKIIDKEDLKIFDKMDELYKKSNILKESIDQIEEGAQNLVNGASALNEGTKLIYENLQTVVNSLEELSKGATKLDEGLKEILKNLQGIKSMLTGFNPNDLQTLIDANSQTINTLTALDPITNANIINLLTQNNNALTQMQTLANKLDPVINTLETYLKQLEAGSKQISDGTKKLSTGVQILNEKTGELNVGTETLYNGTKDLYKGIQTYNKDGITTINNLINGKVKRTQNKIEKLIDLSENYQTFTMKTTDTKASTKFILNIDGVKQQEEKQITKPKEEKTSLWTKIKNLFK